VNDLDDVLTKSPEPSDADAVKRDKKLKNYLVLAVVDDYLSSQVGDAAYTKTAIEVLLKRYEIAPGVLLHQLDKEWVNLKMQPEEDVSSFVDRTLLLVKRLKHAGHGMNKKVINNRILSGMPPELLPCVQQLHTTNLDDVEVVRLALMAAEAVTPKPSSFFGNKGKGKGSGRGGSSASSSSGSGSSGGGGSGSGGGGGPRCFSCNEKGHFSRECPNRKKKKPLKHMPASKCEPVMSFYGEKPYESVGFQQTPEEERKSRAACMRRFEEKKQALIAQVEASCNPEWVMDSGSPCHVTNNVALLENVRKPDFTSMRWGEGSSVVVAQGDAHVQLSAGSNLVQVVLTNVVYVPAATRNLLSLIRIVAVGGSAVFDNGRCTLLSPGGKELGVGYKAPSGHYVLKSTALVQASTTSYVADPVQRAQLVHRRMGHLGWDACSKLPVLCEGLDGGGYRILTTSGSFVVAHTVKFLEHTVTGDVGDESDSSGSAAAGGGSGQAAVAPVGQQPGDAVQQVEPAVPPAAEAAGAGADAGGQGVPPAAAPVRRSTRTTAGVPPRMYEPEAAGSRVQRQHEPPPAAPAAAVRLPVVVVGGAQQQPGPQQQGAEGSGSAFRG
jgi:hypothetical protein